MGAPNITYSLRKVRRVASGCIPIVQKIPEGAIELRPEAAGTKGEVFCGTQFLKRKGSPMHTNKA